VQCISTFALVWHGFMRMNWQCKTCRQRLRSRWVLCLRASQSSRDSWQVLHGGVSAAGSADTAEPTAHDDVATSPKTRIKALMKDGSWAATVNLPHPSSTGQCYRRCGYHIVVRPAA